LQPVRKEKLQKPFFWLVKNYTNCTASIMIPGQSCSFGQSYQWKSAADFMDLWALRWYHVITVLPTSFKSQTSIHVDTRSRR